MSEFQRKLAMAQAVQAEREAAVRREQAAKKAKEDAVKRENEARVKQLEDAAKEARRKELMAANTALTTSKANAGASLEYDPFAEDDYGPSPIAGPSQVKARVANGINRAAVAGSASRGGGGGGGGGGKSAGKAKQGARDREPSPPQMLGRKEKAARAFEQSAKRQGKADSLFSVRKLVEVDERGSVSPRAKQIARAGGPPRSTNTTPSLNKKAVQNVITGKKGVPGLGGGAELRKLAPGRADWDRRTIDEIQRDIRNAKGKGPANGGGGTGMARTASADGSTRSRPDSVSARLGVNGHGKRPRSASPVKRAGMTPAKPASSLSRDRQPRRARSPSSDSSSTSSSESYSRRGHGPHAQRRNRRSPYLEENNVSATIQAMFRRPGRPQTRYDDRDSDGSSDMEAGLSDVEEEERRTAKIARREDELAEREERERKAEKERRKKEAMKR